MSLSAFISQKFGWLLTVAFWCTHPFRFLYKKAFGFDIFISYSRKDGLEFAKGLESALRTVMLCYRDEGDASGGRPLDEIIKKGLQRSRTVVAVLTPEAYQSKWVLDELAAFKERADVNSTHPGKKRNPVNIFPVFVEPCTPENLPKEIGWLRHYLGAKDPNPTSPARATVARIRNAVPGIPSALRMYGAVAAMLLILLGTGASLMMTWMAEARKTWLAAAFTAEAEGRIDRAEWLVAKAAESNPFHTAADSEYYAGLRSRRMLIPAGTAAVKETHAVMALFNTAQGLCTMEQNNENDTVEFRQLANGSIWKLLDCRDHLTHFTFWQKHVFVAAGDQLVCKCVDDEQTPPPVTLPGNCRAMRLADDEVRMLCETDKGANLVLATLVDGQPRLTSVQLQGELPPLHVMALMKGAEFAVCSASGSLTLGVRYWSRAGAEVRTERWSYPDSAVQSTKLIHGDRYLIFESMPYFPGNDPRKEPAFLALDLRYPQSISPGGRAVQQISQDYADVKSFERSKAFAAAFGSGRELRFWEDFNPPLARQLSIPITNGIENFEPWEAPPTTPFFPDDAAVVLVTKRTSLEIYAERYLQAPPRLTVDLVAKHIMEDGFENGRLVVSADGAYIGVQQSRQEGQKSVGQIALFQRAGASTNEKHSPIPSSAQLASLLALDTATLKLHSSK